MNDQTTWSCGGLAERLPIFKHLINGGTGIGAQAFLMLSRVKMLSHLWGAVK
jgi:hypothetical protein